MPLATVIISAYNAEPYIAKAMESILSQTVADIELLVVDDGSSDGTLDVIRRFRDGRIKVFSQQNTGKAVAVNRLLDMAEGEFLMLQDADDWAAPDRVEKLTRAFHANPKVGIVFSGYAVVIGDKVCAPRRSAGDEARCRKNIENFTMPGLDPTMMVRTGIARSIRFDPSLRIGQGFDFILKAGEQHPVMLIPDVLYFYRFHYQSITKADPSRRAQFLLRVINAARQRRGMPLLPEEEFLSSRKQYLEDANNNLAGHFTDAAYWSVIRGHRQEALQTAALSLRYAPKGGLNYVKPLVYAVLPGPLVRMVRKD